MPGQEEAGPARARTAATRRPTRVAIVLEDGSVFEGRSFGAEVPADGTFGEVVFQTGMVGYAEALTDPSYRGQCLTMTYPMVGNYGVPDETLRDAAQPLLPRKTFESEAIHATAVVCQDYSADYSHWDATQSLGAWLAKSGVPGVTGVDTRRLTKVDCGMKANMVRELNARGVSVLAVPWDHDFDGVLDDYDGLFLSNGPGDPEQCAATIAELRKTLAREGDAVRPVFGICLGNQLTGLAAGAKTTKLRFGNRGQNQPVLDALHPGACMVTSQNHGFAAGRVPGGAAPAEALVWPKMASSAPQPEFPKKVLLLGSGGLSIGQAGEFDYSGAQAIKALKEEGVEVVLMNPNIASVQTNVDPPSPRPAPRGPGAADRVFFLPVTPPYVESVIAKEKPDAVLISMGGQTALNCGIELDHSGVLSKHGVRVLGTSIDTVIATEDREIFKNNGICADAGELEALATKALAVSPQLLIEKSMLGWKEVEYEVVRDVADNCITVCNMENFDPLGVHTGDSIVVAPSQTLSNEEYHMLRSAALRVVRHLGIVGECNIQYALHPTSLEYCIIEVNPRLSRSSALASKATGYPLAFVAAKLAMGVTLPELRNSVTGGATIMGFEPALDYCVTKFPRWDLSKFAGAQRVLGSAMASVGEVMAIGRTFEESFQKALRMVDPANPGFEPVAPLDTADAELERKLVVPTDRRVWSIAEAMYRNAGGWDKDRVRELTKIDDWFLSRLEKIAAVGRDGAFWAALKTDLAAGAGADALRRAKQLGFTDDQIARQLGTSDDAVRAARKALGVTPVVKQIDTLAAEYAAQTNYLYTTYHGDDDDVASGADGLGGTMVLGSGPYRIGSSVEFDWCAVSAMRALRESGRRGIMVNCNPETVSTDYDECDALYFEELSKERVMDIYDMERVDNGVVISMGGQIPQNLAVPVHEAGGTILGTHPDMIDAAEDRSKFSALMDAAGVDQPKWAELESHASAVAFADDVGYPVLAHEHVEDAGVHSGDATLLLPPQSLSDYTLNRARDATAEVVRQLNISGPFNIQFLVGGRARDAESRPEDELDGSFPSMNDVRIIECNLRASRSVPFVSRPRASTSRTSRRALAGLPLPDPAKLPQLYPTAGAAPENFVAVKAPMFSFSRLRGADPALGVEMSSTGEVFEMIAASLTKHAKGEILAANPTDLFSYYENEAATDAWTQKDEFH
ncbi:carbamoyl-phosphate synthase [Aureococcus anophagefferens]|nr:carbamoyl-phosphate synthase [Aureococcus anophagefferens]